MAIHFGTYFRRLILCKVNVRGSREFFERFFYNRGFFIYRSIIVACAGGGLIINRGDLIGFVGVVLFRVCRDRVRDIILCRVTNASEAVFLRGGDSFQVLIVGYSRGLEGGSNTRREQGSSAGEKFCSHRAKMVYLGLNTMLGGMNDFIVGLFTFFNGGRSISLSVRGTSTRFGFRIASNRKRDKLDGMWFLNYLYSAITTTNYTGMARLIGYRGWFPLDSL